MVAVSTAIVEVLVRDTRTGDARELRVDIDDSSEIRIGARGSGCQVEIDLPALGRGYLSLRGRDQVWYLTAILGGLEDRDLPDPWEHVPLVVDGTRVGQAPCPHLRPGGRVHIGPFELLLQAQGLVGPPLRVEEVALFDRLEHHAVCTPATYIAQGDVVVVRTEQGWRAATFVWCDYCDNAYLTADAVPGRFAVFTRHRLLWTVDDGMTFREREEVDFHKTSDIRIGRVRMRGALECELVSMRELFDGCADNSARARKLRLALSGEEAPVPAGHRLGGFDLVERPARLNAVGDLKVIDGALWERVDGEWYEVDLVPCLRELRDRTATTL